MKQFKIVILLAASCDAYGQVQPDKVSIDPAFERITAVLSVIFVVYILAAFVMAITRLVLNTWLKNKLIGKEIKDDIILKLFNNDRKEVLLDALKWGIIFAGTGIGLLISSVFPPLGIHTLSILAFALAGSFFVYYLLVKHSG